MLRLTILFLFAWPVYAQEAINYASVSGRVTDQTGAIVEGARVTARQLETNLKNITTTNLASRSAE